MTSRFATAAGLGLALIILPATSSGQAGKAAGRLADVFADIDANHNGVLDPSEIDAANKPAFKKLLVHGDANDDGKIDSKEFEALAKKAFAARKDAGKPGDASPKPEAAKPEATAGEKPGQFLQRFEAMDANKDGKVSREEFKGRPAMFDRLDADHDGAIDKSDLKVLRDKRKAGEGAKPDQAKKAGAGA